MGYGGIAAVLVAGLTALTVLPALLAVLGHRVDALRIRLPRWLSRYEPTSTLRPRGTGPRTCLLRPRGECQTTTS